MTCSKQIFFILNLNALIENKESNEHSEIFSVISVSLNQMKGSNLRKLIKINRRIQIIKQKCNENVIIATKYDFGKASMYKLVRTCFLIEIELKQIFVSFNEHLFRI